LECEEDLCVCVSLCLYFSCEKNPKHKKVQKSQKRVKTSLSLFLSSNSINFFHKAQNFLKTKIERTSRPGVTSCTINPNSAILRWLQFMNLKPWSFRSLF
jgi:hypothetical protein